VWGNHYNGLLVPWDRTEPATLMDPHHGGRLGYTAAPIAAIEAVLAPRRVVLVAGGPLQRTPSDIFCAAWMAWWFCDPRPALSDQTRTVFDFLRAALERHQDDFLQYCTEDCGLLPEDGARLLDTIRDTTMDDYVAAYGAEEPQNEPKGKAKAPRRR
jgi:hypothetical protein